MVITTRKSQNAIEFLLNYAWAFLIFFLIIGFMFYSGLLDVDSYLPDMVELSTDVGVEDVYVNENSIEFVFRNKMGKPLRDFRVNVTECNNGQGTLSEPISVAEGDTIMVRVLCEEGTLAGHKFKTPIDVSYIVDVPGAEDYLMKSATGIMRVSVSKGRFGFAGEAKWAGVSFESGNNMADEPVAVAVDSKENVFVLGNTLGSMDFGNGIKFTNKGNKDFFLVKYGKDGTPLWVGTSQPGSGYGYDIPKNIYLDGQGNAYVFGKTNGDIDFGNGNNLVNTQSNDDLFVVKYNSSGHAQWVVSTNDLNSNLNYEDTVNFYVDNIGNVYVLGKNKGANGGGIDFGNGFQLVHQGGEFDFFVVKYDTNGDTQWVGQAMAGGLSGDNNDIPKNMLVDGEGNVYVAGTSTGDITFSTGKELNNQGEKDFFVVKYNSAGDVQWVKTSQVNAGINSGLYNDEPIDMRVAGGNLYLLGITNSSIDFGNSIIMENKGNQDFFLVKYSSGGEPVWVGTSQAGGSSGTGDEQPNGMEIDSEGNVYIIGSTDGSIDFGNDVSFENKGGIDFFLVKFNSEGDPLWLGTSFDMTGTGNDELKDIIVDRTNNVYVLGDTESDEIDFGGRGNVLTANPLGNGGKDFFVVKYHPGGEADWMGTSLSTAQSGVQYDSVKSFYVDEDGYVYVMGNSNGDIDFGVDVKLSNQGNNQDFFLVRYNFLGQALWVGAPFVGGSDDYPLSFYVQSQEAAYLLGYSLGDLNFGNNVYMVHKADKDFFMVKYS